MESESEAGRKRGKGKLGGEGGREEDGRGQGGEEQIRRVRAKVAGRGDNGGVERVERGKNKREREGK